MYFVVAVMAVQVALILLDPVTTGNWRELHVFSFIPFWD